MRTLSEIATILDDMADVMFQLAGAVAGHDKLKEAGANLFDSQGNPVDLRELAKDLRERERLNK